MKIKNTTNATITIGDLPGPQSGAGLALPANAEILLFDEDAEKSNQLGALLTAGVVIKLNSDEPNTGQPNAAQPGLTIGIGGAPLKINGVPSQGQIIIADSATEASWQTSIGGGSVPDSTTTVKGIVKLSIAPVLPSSPIAAGDNDPRLSDARTPLSHGLAGAEHSAATLAQLNAKVTGEQIVGASDARLSDARTPSGSAGGDLSGTYPNPAVAKVNGVTLSGVPSAGQVLTASGAAAASWVTPSGGSPDASTTVKGSSKLSVAPLAANDPIAAGDNDPRLSDSRAPSGAASGDLSGTFPSPTVAKVNGVTVTGTPTSGQVITATGAAAASWQTPAGGGAADASTTVKGITKLSTAPASPSDPIAAGDNDARLSDARTPLSHGLAGAEHSASTLAQLNSKLSDAVLIDTGDTRLSNARTPLSHGLAGAEHSAATLAQLNAKISDAVLIDTNDARLSNSRTPSGAAGGDLSGTYPNPQVADVDGATGLLTAKQKSEFQKAGVVQGTRPALNLIEGANVTLTVADNPGQDRVDVTIAATGGGGGGPATAYNGVSLYQVVSTSGQTVWIKSSSSLRTGISWSRATTVLTVTDVAHGRAVGERVIVRGANMDYQAALIATTPNADSFTIATTDTGAASGSAAAYSMGFTFAHNAGAGSITSGTLTAPANANVQIMSLRAYLAANTRSTTTYDLIVPASVVNGAGGDTGEDDLYVPICAVRQQASGSDSLMSSVGFTLTKAIGGNFGRFQLANLGSTATAINMQMSF